MTWYRYLSLGEYILITLFIAFYAFYVYRTYQKARFLGTSAGSVWIKVALRTCYFVLLIMALLGPSFGEVQKEVKAVGKDIFLLVDVSRSMDANDVQPTRIERVKHELKELVNSFRAERIGLIIFTTDAYMQCPLTYDPSAITLSLETLNTGLISDSGTDLAPSFRLALEKFKQEETTAKNGGKQSKIMVLITDGEDFGEEAEDAVSEALEAGIRVFALGVGTEEGGRIPNGTDYKRDRLGDEVVTKLNKNALKDIADKADGRYFEITNTRSDMNRLISAIQEIEGEVRDIRKMDASANKYYYFLYAALALILVDLLLTVRLLKI
ncbi:vWA domain-containing protein [Hugenholtzia roseola]|uniref:vWA domain-containing protein n=1 Tax=Hugenholtzia roseola TaxID=1002 RepID=UPI0003FC23EE|nr:VWA domain-containing protein [Hugenholtzia roseola]